MISSWVCFFSRITTDFYIFNLFSSIQSLSCVWLFVTPRTAALQAFLFITNSQSLLKLMEFWEARQSRLRAGHWRRKAGKGSWRMGVGLLRRWASAPAHGGCLTVHNVRLLKSLRVLWFCFGQFLHATEKCPKSRISSSVIPWAHLSTWQSCNKCKEKPIIKGKRCYPGSLG